MGSAVQQAAINVTITNRLGLHARPAMAFVDAASDFTSNVTITKGNQTVNGKSIMQIMMLAATQGTELTINAEGPDAETAVAELGELVKRKFDEQ